MSHTSLRLCIRFKSGGATKGKSVVLRLARCSSPRLILYRSGVQVQIAFNRTEKKGHHKGFGRCVFRHFLPQKAPGKKAPIPLSAVPPLRCENSEFPIPKGDNPYAVAKRFEYIHKDLAQAEKYYRIAIAQRIRVESAIKDLAGVLHQQGRTQEACDLLESHKRLFVDSQTKFVNLLESLRTQSRNASFKYLRLSGLPDSADEAIVKSMFSNPNRIHSVFLVREGNTQTAVLQFLSLSAARKTVEGFRYPLKYRLDSVSLPVETSESVAAAFDHFMFAENCDAAGEWEDSTDCNEEQIAEKFLGPALYRCICLD